VGTEVLYLAAVVALGFAAQWIASRLHLPAILLLLAFGIGLGHLLPVFAGEGPEIASELLFAGVSLAVAVILFEGGLSLQLGEVRETGGAVIGLVTVGIGVTLVLSALAARYVLGFPPAVAALCGAILVVSGPTVIMPLLRQIRPARKIGSIVKWEGIINDPIGAILAVLIFSAIVSGRSEEPLWIALVPGVGYLLIGIAVGLAVGGVFIQLLKRYWIPDHLQNLALLTGVFAALLAANRMAPESGLVAVTVFGMVLANVRVVPIKHIVEFKENLRVLLISCLFIVLGSRLTLDDLLQPGWAGVAFAAILIVVIRPAAVMLSTIGQKVTLRERLFLSWMHPRGIVAAAVSSVFALELSHHQAMDAEILEAADAMVAVTFLTIAVTVAVYGLTAGLLARWLGIAESKPQGVLFAGAGPLVRQIADVLRNEGFRTLLVDTNHQNTIETRMAGLDTSWANVCSEYARDELNLGGIGRFLAMTPNEEVNALAVDGFAEVFGRAEVYQLANGEKDGKGGGRLVPHRPGRTLFSPQASYMYLNARLAAGAVIKKTTLGEEFGYVEFRVMYGETAIVMFVINPSGRLQVCTADTSPEPVAGQTLISLVEEADEAG